MKKKYDIVNWDMKYSVGIARIYMEHKIFLDLIRNFQIEAADNLEEKRLAELVLEIEKYAEFHFVSEENFMNLINYPEIEKHKNLHFNLLEKFNVVKHNNMSSSEIFDFLFSWFIHHTVNEDKQILNFCIENGIDTNFKYNITND